MGKEIAVIDIRNRSYKLVVGYYDEEKVQVIYSLTHPLTTIVKDGEIFNLNTLVKDLEYIKRIDDPSKSIKLNIYDVVLVYPSFGLRIFNANSQTNTISPDSHIEKMDIVNCLSLVKKQKLPDVNSELIDVLPNYFAIEGNKQFYVPPIGEVSSSITMNANVYSLPKKLMTDLRKAVTDAGLNIKKEVISPVGDAYYLMKQNYRYKIYVLIEIGKKTTTLNFVANGKVYESNFISIGGDDLTESIATKLGIPFVEAENLKKIYGLDTRKNSFNPYITKKTNEVGLTVGYTKEDLNGVVADFLKYWSSNLSNALKTLLGTNYSEYLNKIPLVLIGEASKLNGLKDYLLRIFQTNPIDIIKTNVIGADSTSFFNCLGAICYASSYKSLDDLEKSRVNELERDTKKVSRNTKYSETSDEL